MAKLLKTVLSYVTGKSIYEGCIGTVNLIDIDPIYRKKVINMAPPLSNNEKVSKKIQDILGTDEFIINKADAEIMMPWTASSVSKNKRVTIKEVLDFLERVSYDAFLTKIPIYKGKTRGKDVYAITAKGDCGEDTKEKDFGGLEVFLIN